MTPRHLAHFNWATLKAPIGDPAVKGFVDAVPAVNARAEAAPGFIWRSGEEMALGLSIGWPLFTADERMIASFSVWETPQALRDYVFKAVHGAFYSRRSEWFLPNSPETPSGHALWWVPAGHIPEITEARARVEQLDREGPSDAVFTFAEVAP